MIEVPAILYCPRCQKENEYIAGRFGLVCSICGYEGFINKRKIQETFENGGRVVDENEQKILDELKAEEEE